MRVCVCVCARNGDKNGSLVTSFNTPPRFVLCICSVGECVCMCVLMYFFPGISEYLVLIILRLLQQKSLPNELTSDPNRVAYILVHVFKNVVQFLNIFTLISYKIQIIKRFALWVDNIALSMINFSSVFFISFDVFLLIRYFSEF